MFGAMPSDFMVFDVSEQLKVEQDEDQRSTSSDVNTSKWDVNHRCVGMAHGINHNGVSQSSGATRLSSGV